MTRTMTMTTADGQAPRPASIANGGSETTFTGDDRKRRCNMRKRGSQQAKEERKRRASRRKRRGRYNNRIQTIAVENSGSDSDEEKGKRRRLSKWQ